MTKTLVRLAAVLTIALSTSACSTISDLIGDDTPDATPAADASGFPPDTAPPAANADGTKPDLAAIPDKPTGTTSPDAQRATSDSLAADAARSRYSSDALRGGTEPAAAPPPPASATPAPAPEVASNPPPASPPPADNSAAGPAPDNSATAPAAPVAAMPAVAPSSAQPAVPANASVPGSQPMAASDAALGFKPSAAPPLDPSISQFVAQPIIARYQETASNAGVATGPIAPMNAGQPTPGTKRAKRGTHGPTAMSGSVVANLDAVNNPTASVYANAVGGRPAAVVLFPGDGTAVTAAARAQIRSAVSAFRQRGGTGFIKVVGHSSSRTANMPVEKHLMAIFAKSQARANAVAHEIIRDGVPASHVLVEAVGDSQPVYYESMPQGEAGNRRAEIFIQG
jgi:outer membrane protein OmpA-like peptidoglycan-associated protein